MNECNRTLNSTPRHMLTKVVNYTFFFTKNVFEKITNFFKTKYTVFLYFIVFFLLGKLPWKTMCYAQLFLFAAKYFIAQNFNKGI